MHIGNNVTKCLWKIIYERNIKGKFDKVISDIEQVNIMQHLTQCYSDGKLANLPWLLPKKKIDVVKEII